MNWVVYMVKCNDSSIYTGISNNLKQRLNTHAKGNGSKYGRARLPFKLVYTEEYQNRSQANKREIETTVLADNGEILVLGGLISEDIQESVNKVPILGDLPLIGVLFR